MSTEASSALSTVILEHQAPIVESLPTRDASKITRELVKQEVLAQYSRPPTPVFDLVINNDNVVTEILK